MEEVHPEPMLIIVFEVSHLIRKPQDLKTIENTDRLIGAATHETNLGDGPIRKEKITISSSGAVTELAFPSRLGVQSIC